MFFDGISIVEGSSIANLTVAHGTDFPAEPSIGELFYKTSVGLFLYDGSAWNQVKDSATSTDISPGTGISITGSVVSLSSGVVTPGTYPKVTVDTYGRVTTGTTLSSSDVPNLDWSKITTGKPTTLAGYGITDGASLLDGDLTAIAALSGTSGLLKKTAADTWTLDTSTYAVSNQTMYIGTTATAINRSSADLALTGITSITGTGGGVDICGGIAFNGGGAPINIISGQGNGTSQPGGIISLKVGLPDTLGNPGYINIQTNGAATNSVVTRFVEASLTNYVGLKSPDTVTTSRTWTLPQDDPSTAAGKVLTTDSSGILSFTSVPTGTTDTTAAPNTIAKRDSSGDIYAVNFVSTSDRKMKEEIKPVSDGLELVKALQGVTFRWKNTANYSIGVIAQDVEEILPSLVFTGESGQKSVNYDGIIGVLIEAIKELNVKVKKLEEER